MHRAICALTAVLVTVSTTAPSFAASPAAGAATAKRGVDPDSALARQDATVDRQTKVWSRLAASICSGCITPANRVTPMNFERDAPQPAVARAAEPTRVAAKGAEPVRVAARVSTPPRRFVQLRKNRLARLHRRERLRLAQLRHRLHLAALAKRHRLRAAALRRLIHRPATAAIIPVYVPAMETRVYRIPVDQPGLPRDDGRWHETILPTPNRLRRT